MSRSSQLATGSSLGLESGLEALASSDEFRGPVESLDGNDSNDHLALLYESTAEQFEVAIPFVRQGLADGERCMYVVDDNSKDEVLAAMREGGIDVDAALDSGALTLHSKRDTYCRDGGFDPDEMIAFLDDAIDQAVEEYEALRVAGEMTWIYGDDPDVADLIEYEGKLNSLFPDKDCIALCQYNRERFPPEVIRDVVRTHPHLVYDGTVVQNFYYTPPEEFFGPERPDREIDRMLGTLRERAVAKTSLQTNERFLRKLYETIADGDSTFEAKVERLLEIGRRYLDLDIGFLSQIDDDAFEIVDVVGSHELIQPGATAPFEESYCRRVIDADGPLGVENAPAEGWEDDAAYERYELDSFLGISVGDGGEPYGTLCFADTNARDEPFSEGQQTFVELMGEWLSYELDRMEREQHLRAQNEIAASPELSFDEKLQAMFELGCERFGLELGGMATVDPEADRFEIEYVSDDHEHFEPGTALPLSETYCTAAIEGDSTAGVSDPVKDGYGGITARQEFGLEAYLGTHVEVEGGPDRTFFFVSSEPRDEAFSCQELTFQRMMGQWVKYELDRRQREQLLRRAYDITSGTDRSFDEKLDALLELGRERFGVDIGMLTREHGDAFEIEKMRGDHPELDEGTMTPPMTENYCRRVVNEGETICVGDAGEAGWTGDALYSEFGLESYAGVQLTVGDEPYGTICFSNLSPREAEFSSGERTFLEMIGQWVEYEIEQRRREDRLAALNGLSRDLMEPKTAVETSERVVDAAAETLDLPVAAIGMNDEEAGVLEPVATTDAGETLVSDASLLSAGEGVGWEAFVNDAPRRQSDPLAGSDAALHPNVSEVAAFPLGKQGVFLAGSTSAGGFADDDYDFVETVAANVAAAFGRARREQQLRTREETLAEQTESLSRLDRINTIIRSIDQALVGASSRAEIERVVCEELAGDGPYELAWIGDYDSVTETITPAERAGAKTGYLDEIEVTTEGRIEELEPAAGAIETGEPQVVDEMLDDPPFDPWRQASLNRGYQSAVALPLHHGDSTFGVLAVYAGESGVFDDLERAVLTELSDTIGYAMNAVKSKKALVSDEVTELEFSVPDETLEIVELVRETGCEFVYENAVPQADGGLRVFFRTTGASPDAIREMQHRLAVEELTLVSERDDEERTCLFEAVLADWSLTATVIDHGGRIDAIRAEDGVATVAVEVASGSTVREFVEMFRTKYPEATLTAKRTRERSHETLTEFHASLTEGLTPRQLEALRTAFHSGYFESPRERTGSEVAASMDISQPTFNNHLRAAQRKLYGELFEADSSPA